MVNEMRQSTITRVQKLEAESIVEDVEIIFNVRFVDRNEKGFLYFTGGHDRNARTGEILQTYSEEDLAGETVAEKYTSGKNST